MAASASAWRGAWPRQAPPSWWRAGIATRAGARLPSSKPSAARRWRSRSTSRTRPPSWRSWPRRWSDCGRLDVLVNNAGTNIRQPAHELALGEWRQVIDTNLTSAFMCATPRYPVIKRQGGGKIINIGSMMSIFGAAFAPAYAASKGGIVQLTRSLASAWARDNIQANAVLPGWIDTDLPQCPRAGARPPRECAVAAPRTRGGARAMTWRASPSSWPAARPISSRGRRFRWMAAIRS